MFEKELTTHFQSSGKTAESYPKRKHNIDWITGLSRTRLAYQKNTKQILVNTTTAGEQVFIQYPGKESSRYDEKARPWDFFPRIIVDDTYYPDLDFEAIWEILFEGLNLLVKNDKKWSSILATIFYRLAFMCDHQLSSSVFKTTTKYISYKNNMKENIDREKTETLSSLYQYRLDKKIFNTISKIVPDWGGMSFEAFLDYNDLLAWNEDCKYFYRLQQNDSGDWIRNTGRINTLLTHIGIVGYVSGKIKFSNICMKFARGKGVAPITRDEIFRLCNGYILE